MLTAPQIIKIVSDDGQTYTCQLQGLTQDVQALYEREMQAVAVAHIKQSKQDFPDGYDRRIEQFYIRRSYGYYAFGGKYMMGDKDDGGFFESPDAQVLLLHMCLHTDATPVSEIDVRRWMLENEVECLEVLKDLFSSKKN